MNIKKMIYKEDEKTRSLIGEITKEDNYFLTILCGDREYRINKNSVILIKNSYSKRFEE